MAKRQKTALCLTPQAMYNQFKRHLQRVFEFSYHFLCKIKSFPIFNIVKIPKLGFSSKKNENPGASPAVREEHPFLCRNSEISVF